MLSDPYAAWSRRGTFAMLALMLVGLLALWLEPEYECVRSHTEHRPAHYEPTTRRPNGRGLTARQVPAQDVLVCDEWVVK